MSQWSPQFQRAFIACCIEGRFGESADILAPDLFSEDIGALAIIIRDFKDSHDIWPTKTLLIEELVPEECIAEAKVLLSLPKDLKALAESEGRTVMRKRALDLALLTAKDMVEDGEDLWDGIPRVLASALETAAPAPEAFNYGGNIIDRHTVKDAARGLLRARTGIGELDKLIGGGLGPGELGLILAPTNRGKSQAAVSFCGQAIRDGGRVAYFSFELQERPLACRFDRNLTMMTEEEIVAKPTVFKKRLEEAMAGDFGRLKLFSAPRYSTTVAQLRDMIDRRLQEWGSRFLAVADYGSVMKYDRSKSKHEALSDVHEGLSAICQEFKIPMWTPFQKNRSGEVEDGGLEQSGGSYDAMSHPDIVLSLGARNKRTGRMTISLPKVREGDADNVTAEARWDLSRFISNEEKANVSN